MTRLPEIDRRSFLALGVGAVAWACGKGGEDPNEGSPASRAISLVATAQAGLAVGDSRQALAVFRGQRPIVPHEITARVFPPKGKAVAVDVQRQSVTFGLGGDDREQTGTEVTDIFSFTHPFEQGGVWGIEATVDGRRARAVFQVLAKDQAEAPIVGEQAIASQSPTTDDARGVDPICTRSPQCSMHDRTIAEALRAGKPAVITFGTPKFCTSRTCGPVVDIVEDAKKQFGAEASFIHIEVWRNEEVVGKEGGDSPTFLEWKLGTEPWIYFVDERGVIRDRWIGAVGTKEVARGVDALLGAGP